MPGEGARCTSTRRVKMAQAGNDLLSRDKRE